MGGVIVPVPPDVPCLGRGPEPLPRVTQVVEETGRNQANVSKHLKMLAEAGLVGRRKEGLQVFYRLEDPLVEKLCKLVCATIVQQAREEVEQKRQLLQGWGAKEP